MYTSAFAVRGVAVLLIVVALGLVRYRPWSSECHSCLRTAPSEATSPQRKSLVVGYLPVTCHLTCPVTDFATRTSSTTRFESQRFTDFPSMAEAFKAGRLQACFFIAPLAMKLREQGLPVKIAYLGHRDGSTVMVRTDSTAKDLRDLRGKKVGIPSRFSNQYLVITKLMSDLGVRREEIQFMELPPPEMPGALAVGAIDAYFIGEPHAARAELDGTGRILHHVKDIWPRFISCVLVVSEKLIADQPDVVADLVRGIAESGEWAERNRLAAATLVAPYFRQDERVLRHVLTSPPDRVSYRMLTPTDEELQQIHDMAVAAGILERPIAMSDLIERRFIPDVIDVADIAMKSTVAGP